MRCFASNGYRGTTTREIAAAVGITEAALYRYFPSKQSLYDALIDAKIAGPPIQELAQAAVRDRDDRAAFTLVATAASVTPTSCACSSSRPWKATSSRIPSSRRASEACAPSSRTTSEPASRKAPSVNGIPRYAREPSSAWCRTT
jgi:AcrR family transcriptional regulator